jgi:hypothetical protein
MPLSRRIQHRIDLDFDVAHLDEVASSLEAFSLRNETDFGGCGPDERLHAAILIRASGDIAEFRAAIELLRLDPRDVLMGTGMEHSDWRRQLSRLVQ